MTLDKIGDDALVDRVFAILNHADPADEQSPELMAAVYRADPNGVDEVATLARNALDDDEIDEKVRLAPKLTDDQHHDLREFLGHAKSFHSAE